MRFAILLSAALLFWTASAAAAEGPEPPSAPTPDEAAQQGASASPGQVPADQGQPQPGTSEQNGAAAAPSDANSSADAVRKAQENGSYRLKDGGMYQPPATRPAPLWNKGYGRT